VRDLFRLFTSLSFLHTNGSSISREGKGGREKKKKLKEKKKKRKKGGEGPKPLKSGL